MAFSFGYSPWLLGLSVLLAGGGTYWSYRHTVPALSSGKRWGLGLLRFLSLVLLCFLLLKPVLRLVEETEQPPTLAVLVDDSRSMRIVQGTDTSVAAVRNRLAPLLEPFSENVPGTARVFGFDTALRPLPDAPTDSLTFAGTRSDLGAALQDVREEVQGQNLQAVALVSDGQHNSGRDPARVADRFSVPVHTITVGDTTRRRDLQIQQVVTNDRAYVDTEVPVRVALTSTDLGDAQTTATLRANDRTVDTAQVSLPDGKAETKLDLAFRPDTPGLHRLTVRAAPVDGEALTENNVRTVRLRVLDSKRRVLLLGDTPSPSYSALRRVLARDANTTLTARVPKKDGSFYGGPLPDTLDRYDAVVCAGFPSAVVPEAAVRRVARQLETGTPALFVIGSQTDLSAWRTHFENVLPATPETKRSSFAEATVAPVKTEHSHPVLQIEGASPDLFRRLPPVQVPSTAWIPTSDARVLARAVRPSLDRKDPALVVRRRAGQRTALLLATGTWRWATLSADLSAADPLWPGLISNLLRWVSTNADNKQVRVRPATATFEGGEPVTFSGQVYDESQAPVSQATLDLVITDSTGTEYPHTMEPLGNGRYALDVGPLPEGTYRYTATATLDGTELGTDSGTFSVGALRLEYQQPRANPVLMRRIAARSGGRAYTAETAAAFPRDLGADSTFAPTVSTAPREAELWRTSLFLAVLLGLLATEWTLRKRFGLS
ncbi:MAG: hypothetical protein BRD55_09830 [Bacteroidetes bacterium SW_9_63_38]|nr:MAG: hypothetical protein BRD55_09830 [Bacteroidetes bacterium SW_9_63_38]